MMRVFPVIRRSTWNPKETASFTNPKTWWDRRRLVPNAGSEGLTNSFGRMMTMWSVRPAGTVTSRNGGSLAIAAVPTRTGNSTWRISDVL